MKFQGQGILNWYKKHTLTIGLLVVFGIGAFLRLYRIGALSLWLDEGSHFALSKYPISYILQSLIKTGLRSPLFLTLLHFAGIIFSHNETCLRLVPAIFGIATLPVVYFLGKRILNQRLAVITYILFALSPFHIWFSRNIKGYTTQSFFLLSFLLLILKSIDSGRLKYSVYAGLCLAAAIYCHYGSIWFAVATILFLILFNWRKLWSRRVVVLASYSIATILSVPAFIMLQLQRANIISSLHKLSGISFQGIIPQIGKLLVLGIQLLPLFLGNLILGNRRVLDPGFIYILGAIAGIGVIAHIVLSKDYRRKMIAMLIMLVVPLFAIQMTCYFSGLSIYTTSRICLYTIFFFYALIASIALAKSDSRWARVFFLMAILFVMLWQDASILRTREQEDWRGAVGYVVKYANPKSDVVGVIRPWGMNQVAHYSRNSGLELFGIPHDWDFFDTQWRLKERIGPKNINAVTENIKEKLQGKQRLWLISGRAHYADPEGVFMKWLDSEFEKVSEKKFPGEYLSISVDCYKLIDSDQLQN